MSTLQALLAGGLKQPIDYVESEGKALKLRELMRADKAGEQAVMDDSALREETMRSANNQDLQKNLLKRGLLKPAQNVASHEAKMQDDAAKLAQTKAQTDETKIKGSAANLKMSMDRTDAMGSAFNAHLRNPNSTPELFLSTLIDMRDRGIFGEGKEGQDTVMKIALKIPNDQAQYRELLKQKTTEYLPMKEYMKNEHDQAVLAETSKNNALTQSGNAETRAQTAKNQEEMRKLQAGQLAVSQGNLAETRRVNSVTEKANAAANDPNAPKPLPKPMPSSALKLQQESIDAITVSGGIDADMGALIKQIDDGKLNLGLVSNMKNRARNYTGNSTEESRNFNTLKASMEKLRNDSLRLNKGTQTEGDAIRAFNEIFENLNDSGVVKQRLQEIRALNKRALQLQKNNVQNVRQNFGHPEMDLSQYENQQAAVGAKGNAVNIDDIVKQYTK